MNALPPKHSEPAADGIVADPTDQAGFAHARLAVYEHRTWPAFGRPLNRCAEDSLFLDPPRNEVWPRDRGLTHASSLRRARRIVSVDLPNAAKTPATIGWSAGEANFVLPNQTVSSRHPPIERRPP